MVSYNAFHRWSPIINRFMEKRCYILSNLIDDLRTINTTIMTRRFFVYLALLALILSCSRDSEALTAHIGAFGSSPNEKQTNYDSLSLDARNTFNWIDQMQYPNGLMQSAEGTDFVSLYDNALAAIAYIHVGEYQKAEKIFDYFNNRIDSELQLGQKGFYQLRNGLGQEKRVRWLGDNAWLLIALNNYAEFSGSNKYKRLSRELELWIRSLQDDDGGLWGGYKDNGTRIHKVTEGMITAFNAVGGYDDFHEGILNYLKENRWDENERLLVAWPDNESYYYALDLHSLGYLVFEDFPISVLESAGRHQTTKTSTISAQKISGYCFDEDLDVIWLEGTAQMALAYRKAGNLDKATRLHAELKKAAIRFHGSAGFSGIPYTTNKGTSYGAVPLWEHADLKPALSSTSWYLFNELRLDPLAVGRKKSIPDVHKFWQH